MATSDAASRTADSRRAVAAGVMVTVAVGVAGLTWAKWVPYVGKAFDAASTHHWPGSNILGVGGVKAGDAPSWHAATTFFSAYVTAIWPALLVALLLSACVQAFVPRPWLPQLLNRQQPVWSAAAGGVAGMPSMMCACCSAPVAVTLRRSGVNHAAAVRFGKALFRLCVVLVPEYFIVVLVIGAGRGWLMDLIAPTHHTVLIVIVAAVVGTLIVIPTAGEIPILHGLALLGISSGALGALLITLPAVSLPGIAMVARSFGWRTTCATAAMVVVAGVAGAISALPDRLRHSRCQRGAVTMSS